MRTLVVAVVIAGSLGAGMTRARAEDLVAYQADGDADAAAPDARVAALDEAFGKAVSQALGDLLEPEVRRQNKPVLDRELVGHARLWVARFKVTHEAVADTRMQLSVSVRVDRDKLRARLAELNIQIRDAAGRDTGRDAAKDPGDTPPANAPSVTVLLRVATPEGVHATYGLSAEKETAGLVALSGALRRAGLVVVRAPASGPAAKADGELPLDDDAAEALAAAAKAELAAVAGVTVGAPVPLRGVDQSSVLITVRVRLVDRKVHKALGQGAAVIASRGTDPGVVGYAIDRALLAAMADVVPPSPQSLAQPPVFTGDDTPRGEPGVVLVRLARTTPWGLVQAELRHLIGARGVSRASLRHVSPSGWVIGVATGESIDRIASVVKKPPTADATVSVKIVGDLVEATMSVPGASGAPASPGTPETR